MKKLLAILMTLVLMFSVVAISASAAGTYGEYEKKVMDLLSAKTEFKSGSTSATFVIPDNYVNQAKAYFSSSEGDITEEQYNKIVEAVNSGKKHVQDAVTADVSLIKNGQVDIAHLPEAVKSQVLKDGQDACAVVDLSLTYNGKHVVITDVSGAVKFEDAAIIKTTGANINTAMMFVVVSAFLALVAGSVVTAKKAQLF